MNAYSRTRARVKFYGKIALALLFGGLEWLAGFSGSASGWHSLKDIFAG
ncbi:MAG: DUF268 domain-containing protein [Clostridia bacterium]|nr:DUF268 domain-containing protein [Clostridia bacterium]